MQAPLPLPAPESLLAGYLLRLHATCKDSNTQSQGCPKGYPQYRELPPNNSPNRKVETLHFTCAQSIARG